MATASVGGYIKIMSRIVNDQEPIAATQPVKPTPAGWVDSLERSKAQVEAGLSVPLEPALNRLRASIARMEAKRASK